MLCLEVSVAFGTAEPEIFAVVSDEEDSVAGVDGSGTEIAPLYSHSTINYYIRGYTNMLFEGM